jgi:hypothetical protein
MRTPAVDQIKDSPLACRYLASGGVVPAVTQGLFLPCHSRWAKQWISDEKIARTGAAASKWPDKAKVSACKAKKTKKLRARQGGSDQTLHAKKKVLHAHQTGLHTGPAVPLSGSKQKKICVPGKWPDKEMALTDAAVCRAAARKKQNTVRQGSDQTRRDSMQKKKVQRDKKRAGDRPATSQKGAARLKKNCRWQTCADRLVRDRFNRSTKAVQPLLTRMVLVKTG